MKHTYITDSIYQERAIAEFNTIRSKLEDMHGNRIKVIKMTRFPYILPVCWRVIYKLEKE